MLLRYSSFTGSAPVAVLHICRDAKIGVIARSGMPILMKTVCRDARVRAKATAPLRPAILRRKKLAQVGQAVRRLMMAPTVPTHFAPPDLLRFE